MALTQVPQGTLDLSAHGAVAAEPARPGALPGKIAFGATALFLVQLYVAPSDWFPALQPARLALVLSALSLGCLVLQRLLSNRPLWFGWRTCRCRSSQPADSNRTLEDVFVRLRADEWPSL